LSGRLGRGEEGVEGVEGSVARKEKGFVGTRERAFALGSLSLSFLLFGSRDACKRDSLLYAKSRKLSLTASVPCGICVCWGAGGVGRGGGACR
jgi:hypothetical protein